MPVANEFPDADERRFTINGHPVTASIYKKVEGGTETVSAVLIQVGNPFAAKRIKDAIDAKGRFKHSTDNPIPDREVRNGLFIIDPERLLSAGGILDEVAPELEFLQGQSKIKSRSAKPEALAPRTAHLKVELTQDQNPAVTRLLQAVFDAFPETDIEQIEHNAMREFMQEVSATIKQSKLIEKMQSPPSEVILPSGRKVKLTVGGQAKKIMEASQVLPTVITVLSHHFAKASDQDEKKWHMSIRRRLETELRNATIDILFPKQDERTASR